MAKEKKKQEKRRPGQPTKYKPEYCQMVIDHMKTGRSLASFAASIGTYRQILYHWQEKNPEFLDACKTAQELSLQWFEEFSMQAATGRIFDKEHKGKYDKYNPNMLQFLMSRRFRDYNANKEDMGSKNEIPQITISYDPKNVGALRAANSDEE